MSFRFYLMILMLAVAAAALTIWVSTVLFPEAPWTGPGTMAALAVLALAWHSWTRRK